ncbi:MAG: hypothetical protein ACLQGP_42230 [Isosphaeraceae bacterium]
MTPPGQRDYSTVHLSRHALERFVERFSAEPDAADRELRRALARTRRLGRNPDNGAIAVVAIHRGRVLVAILQDARCLTVLTWNQFIPRLAEFGRNKLPRKWGRALRRLIDSSDREMDESIDQDEDHHQGAGPSGQEGI